MGLGTLLGRLFNPQPAHICPYCEVRQDRPLTRKRKCQSCKQPIYIDRQEDGTRRLITEQESERLERVRRDARSRQLSREVRKAMKAGDSNRLHQAYNQQAYHLWSGGQPHLHVKEEAMKSQLRSLAGMKRVKQVKIRTCEDNRVCDDCRALDGKHFTIEEALEQMPLPGRHCLDGGNPHGGLCRCVYQAIFD